MDLTTKKPSTVNPAFTLSARQEQLLFAALNSNTKQPDKASPAQNNQNAGIFSMAPTNFTDSPVQAPGSGTMTGLDDSPFIDYDQDFEFDGDGSFDYGFDNGSQGQMIGKLPGTSSDGDAEVDSHDKRSHPDDEEDDEEGGGKRREGDEKSSKKPGRKPLTSEPTSKRKAQNRAAQRAFRERKEKHLKDLETKVDDLQKASESANHENSILRAQIEKMSTELKEYKKKISVGSAGAARSSSLNSKLPAYLSGQGLGGAVSTPNDVNFSFDFPRFGRLPGVSPAGVNGILNGARQSTSPGSTSVSPIDRDQISPRNQSQQFAPPVSTVGSIGVTRPSAMHDGGDMSSLSGLFSPSILESVGKSPEYDFFGNRANTNGSRSSGDGNMSTGHNTSYSSPSASSNSNNGPTSSCGTSPEPTLQSPVMNKPVDSALTTIGEERSGETNTEGELTFCDKLNMACGNSKNPVPRTMSETSTTSGFQPQEAQTPAFDVNGIDWFAQQNDNQFDPQLFNDYREPQDNILSTDAFGDSFFSDAFAIPDFNTPYNIEASPVPPKKDLVQQIDEQQNADDEVVPAEDTSKMLSCNTIWDRLQACPKVKDGDFDLDNLCKDLQKKAKCSETGAVVDESDFQKIMQTYADNNSKQTTY